MSRQSTPPDRPHRRRAFLAVAVVLLAAAPARAESDVILDGQIGPAFLMKSRSSAIGHSLKPMGRVGLRVALLPRVEVGVSASGIVDSSEHYRVLGALAHGRLALVHRPAFSLGAALGLGAGYDADILHGDLTATAPVAPYGFLAIDARWTVGGRWLIGAEAGWDNLSILRLGLVVGLRFDSWSDLTDR